MRTITSGAPGVSDMDLAGTDATVASRPVGSQLAGIVGHLRPMVSTAVIADSGLLAGITLGAAAVVQRGDQLSAGRAAELGQSMGHMGLYGPA